MIGFLCFLVASLAMANAWTPPPRPTCNTVNVNGGSVLLPHEKFCNMFYTCDLAANQVPLYCPDEMLFSYGPGHAVCVTLGYSNSTCPNWACDSLNDVGRKYPSPCCFEYWECTAVKKFERRVCSEARGETFDSVNEVCSPTVNPASACQVSTDQKDYCPKRFQAGTSNVCPHSAAADPCMYRTVGWVRDRMCPGGTSFNPVTCGCNDYNDGCAPSGLSIADMVTHKSLQLNNQCQASGRMIWNVNNVDQPISVQSDRLNAPVDHYFRRPATGFAISQNGQEALFSGTSSVDSFIYDYFYNDNVLYAPTAFRMTIKFNQQTFSLSQQFVLLENRYDPSLSNAHCDPSLRITAQYGGIQLGQQQWTFSVFMRGENGAQSSMQATVAGLDNNYYRITVFFGSNGVSAGNVQSGNVVNRGNLDQSNQGSPSQFQGDNRNLGAALARVKCGFAFCRNFNGALRNFAVYEGCSNFQNIQ